MNTNMNPKPDTSHSSDTVKDRVFAAIEERGVEPSSKYVFLCHRLFVWSLYVLSILFGGLALAVMSFAASHRYYDLYEATHDNFYTYALEVLPYIWVAVLMAMLLLASYQLKKTSRGYRLSVVTLGATSVVCSVVLAGLFHLQGFGFALDAWLGKTAPMYMSQIKMERKMWQNPLEGRLIGRQVITGSTTDQVLFKDDTGKQWEVFTGDLSPGDREYLAKGMQVRLLGPAADRDTFTFFHACGVFPWMLDQPKARGTVSAERRAFVDSMYKHHENAKYREQMLQEALREDVESVPLDSPCHKLKAVERVHARMKS